MSEYKVSVIVPIYNAEKYIEKCIESVMNQSLKEIEVILINDGSEDSSEEKCKQYVNKYEYIQLVNQKNSGQGAARNLGMSLAKGECIFFLDADDYLPQDALEILYNKIITTNSDMVCGTSESVFKDGTKIRKAMQLNEMEKQESGKDIILKTKYKDISPMVWLYMYRKSFIEKNNLVFPIGLFHEDCEFNLKTYYYANKISFIKDVTYCQFISDNSTMRSKNIKKSMDAIQIAKNIEKFISNDVKEEEIKKIFYGYVSFLYSYSLHYAIQIGGNIENIINCEEKKHITKVLRKNIKYWPLSISMKNSLIHLYAKIYRKYLGN